MSKTPEEIQKVVGASLWRIVVDPIEPETESESGFKYPQETIDAQNYLRYYGKVVSMGPLCFTGDRFKDAEGNPVRACEVGF